MQYGRGSGQVPAGGSVRAATQQDSGVANTAKVSACGPLGRYVPEIRRLLVEVGDRLGFRSKIEAGAFDTLDTETTGFDLSKSKIWQVGLVRFNDFKLDRELDLILSISRQDFDNAFSAETDGVKRAALYSKMHLTWERLTEKGIPPLDGVVKMAQFLGSRTDIPILGNNVRSFDMPRIMMMCSQLSGKAVSLPMDRVIDLGAMVKAAQMNAKMLPDETPAGFMSRIANIRAKAIYWSIDYMVAQMNLPVQLDILHDAVADCKVLACAVDCFMSGGTLSDDRRSYWRHVIHGD